MSAGDVGQNWLCQKFMKINYSRSRDKCHKWYKWYKRQKRQVKQCYCANTGSGCTLRCNQLNFTCLCRMKPKFDSRDQCWDPRLFVMMSGAESIDALRCSSRVVARLNLQPTNDTSLGLLLRDTASPSRLKRGFTRRNRRQSRIERDWRRFPRVACRLESTFPKTTLPNTTHCEEMRMFCRLETLAAVYIGLVGWFDSIWANYNYDLVANGQTSTRLEDPMQ